MLIVSDVVSTSVSLIILEPARYSHRQFCSIPSPHFVQKTRQEDSKAVIFRALREIVQTRVCCVTFVVLCWQTQAPVQTQYIVSGIAKTYLKKAKGD